MPSAGPTIIHFSFWVDGGSICRVGMLAARSRFCASASRRSAAAAWGRLCTARCAVCGRQCRATDVLSGRPGQGSRAWLISQRLATVRSAAMCCAASNGLERACSHVPGMCSALRNTLMGGLAGLTGVEYWWRPGGACRVRNSRMCWRSGPMATCRYGYAERWAARRVPG